MLAQQGGLRAAQGESLRLSQELAELRGKTDRFAPERVAPKRVGGRTPPSSRTSNASAAGRAYLAQARPRWRRSSSGKLAAVKQELESAAARYEEAQGRWCRLKSRAPRKALSPEAKPQAATLSWSGRRTRAA